VSPLSQQSRHATLRAAHPRKTYELWRDTDGNYAFFPRDNDSAREGVSQGELVWSVEAAASRRSALARGSTDPRATPRVPSFPRSDGRGRGGAARL
jgi:hypothetical protein